MQQATQTKRTVYNLIETLPPAQLSEVASFIAFIKMRDENKLFRDLETQSVSSMDFWDNSIDDEVWNDV